jgi:hypothetical protein
MRATAGGAEVYNAVDLYSSTSGTTLGPGTTSLAATTAAAMPEMPSAPLVDEDTPIVLITLTGSINEFGQGSARRAAFVSGLAALLGINEQNIAIISVTSGSIIVELGFVNAGNPIPADIVSRLKSAAASGGLNQFGFMGLKIVRDAVSKTGSGIVAATSSVDTDFHVIVRYWFVFVILFWLLFLFSFLMVFCSTRRF